MSWCNLEVNWCRWKWSRKPDAGVGVPGGRQVEVEVESQMLEGGGRSAELLDAGGRRVEAEVNIGMLDAGDGR
eukprot:8200323-Pyramimonas_sp.AAC.1